LRDKADASAAKRPGFGKRKHIVGKSGVGQGDFEVKSAGVFRKLQRTVACAGKKLCGVMVHKSENVAAKRRRKRSASEFFFEVGNLRPRVEYRGVAFKLSAFGAYFEFRGSPFDCVCVGHCSDPEKETGGSVSTVGQKENPTTPPPASATKGREQVHRGERD